MFNWLREWYELRRDARHCETCEILKMELAIVRQDNQKLLDRILEVPAPEAPIDTTDLKPILPKYVPWNVKRQMLEAESREQARLLKEQQQEIAPSGGKKFDIEQLEKEIGVK